MSFNVLGRPFLGILEAKQWQGYYFQRIELPFTFLIGLIAGVYGEFGGGEAIGVHSVSMIHWQDLHRMGWGRRGFEVGRLLFRTPSRLYWSVSLMLEMSSCWIMMTEK